MLKMRSEGTIKELPEDILLPPISHVEQEDLTFLDLLLIITQRKRLIGIVTAVCTGITDPGVHDSAGIHGYGDHSSAAGELVNEFDAGEPALRYERRHGGDGEQHARNEEH
jgi:hypothetical protein